MNKKIRIVISDPILFISLPIAFIAVIFLVMINPLIKIRVGFIRSERIGHFVANTELYLCEKEVSKNSFIDIFYYTRKPCNQQLAKMWKRSLIIFPNFILRPIDLIIRSTPMLIYLHAQEARGGARDIDNFLDVTEPHLKFTEQEKIFGMEELRNMGILPKDKFICLNVRDNAYLKNLNPNASHSYHDYRNSGIEKYVLVCEKLAELGLFILRMGAIVESPLKTNHPRIIDYANSSHRSEFMDVFLGSRCEFSITTGSGWDAIPEMMRRPLLYVNFAPIGEIHTFSKKFVHLAKIHQMKDSQKKLSLKEIFEKNVGYSLYSDEYNLNGVLLIENTPEEIADAALEMVDYIGNNFNMHDRKLQNLFQDNFPSKALSKGGIPLHGEIRGLYSNSFLLKNKDWFLV